MKPGVQRSLTSVLAVAAIPYGMTLVVSCELLLVRHYRGSPSVFEVFAFAFGAVGGYIFLAAVGGTDARAQARPFRATNMIRIGTMHVVPLATALGLAAGMAQIPSWVAWPATSFVGIGSYVAMAVVSALLVSAVGRESLSDTDSR